MISMVLAAALSLAMPQDSARENSRDSSVRVTSAMAASPACPTTTCGLGDSERRVRLFEESVRGLIAEGRCDRALRRVTNRPGQAIEAEVRATCEVAPRF